jgi:hypothetical protein
MGRCMLKDGEILCQYVDIQFSSSIVSVVLYS